MTNEAEQSASEEQENPQDAERQHHFELGKSVAKSWARNVKNTLEAKKGEWVNSVELLDVADDWHGLSAWGQPGFKEGIEQGLKDEGIEEKQATREETGLGTDQTWYRVA